MKITGAIFDLDGTLIDSMGMWNGFAERFLEAHNIKVDEDVSAKIMSMTVETSAHYIHQNYLPELSPDEIRRRVEDSVLDAYTNTIPIKHGVKPFLFALRCRGVRMCVATASPRNLAEVILKRLNIDHYFSCILTCPELNTTKDEPLIFDRALDILGTDKDTTYVFEDALHSIRTAKLAGFKVVAVKEDTAEEHIDDIKALCDVYVKDFDDFRGMII